MLVVYILMRFKKREIVRPEKRTFVRFLFIGILLQDGFNDARTPP